MGLDSPEQNTLRCSWR